MTTRKQLDVSYDESPNKKIKLEEKQVFDNYSPNRKIKMNENTIYDDESPTKKIKLEENKDDNSLSLLIQKYKDNSSEYPFLEHVNYFRNSKDRIDRSSIATQWKKLTKESYIKTFIKGHITMRGANQNLATSMAPKTCPWRVDFDVKEFMPLLKHPCDTGAININGSINIDNLETMMTSCFEFDSTKNLWFIRQSVMFDHLKKCAERDKLMASKSGCLMPSWITVAWNEWNDAFGIFSDGWQLLKSKYEPTISADTFLQFYFQPNVLYQRVLDGELPISKTN
jgi:hypothetical protein